MMKKKQSIIALVLAAIVTVLLGWTMIKGWGPTGTGSMKNINLGLDLSGGVSITYQAVKDNPTLTPDECDTLKRYATNGILFHAENERLKGKLESAQKSASIWKQRCEEANKKYQELKQKAQPFLDALEIASEKVRAFINSILARGKETQEHKAPARKRGQDMEI